MSRSRSGQIRLRSPDRRRFDARVVMPEGSQAPQIYLVGEAPGRQEAEAGRPFVGPAGTALRDMIREAGMEDAQIRLSNALPFRPIERSAMRLGRPRPPCSAPPPPLRTRASKCSAFRICRSGLPIIRVSCCASAEEDRSCGEQPFVICVPIGNERDPVLLSLLEEASGESCGALDGVLPQHMYAYTS
jgi:hypothetical protein